MLSRSRLNQNVNSNGSATLLTMTPFRIVSRQIFLLCAIFVMTVMVITPARADLCTVQDAHVLFKASRKWLDEQVLQYPLDLKPPDFTKGVSLSPTFSVTAAGVVLRLNGRPVGQAWSKQNPECSLCLSTALLNALRQANNDRVLAALPLTQRASAAQQLSLEIEFVGDTRPLTGDHVDALALRIDNGRQAMAIRAGDRWAFSLPSLQQSLNQTQLPWYTMIVLARDVGVEAGADKKYQLPQGVVVYRADTVRLAQIKPKDAPFLVSRAMVTVPLVDITASALDDMAVAIAAHLESRIRNCDGLSPEIAATLQALGPAGEYQPALGSLTQQVCSPLEQGMSAFAMAQFSQMNFSEKDRLAARAFVETTLHSLQQVVGEEKDPLQNPAAAAACLLACQTMNHCVVSWGNPECEEWQKKLKATVLAQFQLDPRTDVQTWALCAAALAQDLPEEVAKGLQSVWNIRPVGALLSASPWLLLAQQRLENAPDLSSAINAWKLLEIMLMENQLTRKLDPDLAADLEGGWPILTNGVTSATAQSSRPTLALALSMNSKIVGVSNSHDVNMESLKLALRFLKQLQVDQASCYAFRDAGKALGGIRAAPWDSSQPLGANATTLLAILEARQLFTAKSSSIK